jgi:hypothetical protein
MLTQQHHALSCCTLCAGRSVEPELYPWPDGTVYAGVNSIPCDTTLRNPLPLSCVCRSVEPELYPRPDGTVYACGEPQAVPVPSQGPAGVTVDASRCNFIQVRLWKGLSIHGSCLMAFGTHAGDDSFNIDLPVRCLGRMRRVLCTACGAVMWFTVAARSSSLCVSGSCWMQQTCAVLTTAGSLTCCGTRCAVVQGVAGSLASCLSDAAVEAEQACFLPLSSDGLPVIGR